MTRKILFLCFLFFLVTPMLQTTTPPLFNMNQAMAQGGQEFDPNDPTTWPPCPLCYCYFDEYAECCCGGVDICDCILCGEQYDCGEEHICCTETCPLCEEIYYCGDMHFCENEETCPICSCLVDDFGECCCEEEENCDCEFCGEQYVCVETHVCCQETCQYCNVEYYCNDQHTCECFCDYCQIYYTCQEVHVCTTQPSCDLGLTIGDGNNPSRIVGQGQILKMVATNGDARTANFWLTNASGYTAPAGYPIWYGIYGNGMNATASFSSSGSVDVAYNQSCPQLTGNVQIMAENITEIDFGQYIDLYFNNISNITSNAFSSASTPLTSNNTFSGSNSSNLTYLGKNVDQYLDGGNIGRYHSLTGTISYTINVPKLKSPSLPVAGFPWLTFSAYLDGEALNISGSASMIKDPSISSETSGQITLSGAISELEGGINLTAGAEKLASLGLTGAIIASGLSVTGNMHLNQSNIAADGSWSMGEISGEISINAKYLDSSITLGSWDKTFLTASSGSLGSVVLYSY